MRKMKLSEDLWLELEGTFQPILHKGESTWSDTVRIIFKVKEYFYQKGYRAGRKAEERLIKRSQSVRLPMEYIRVNTKIKTLADDYKP